MTTGVKVPLTRGPEPAARDRPQVNEPMNEIGSLKCKVQCNFNGAHFGDHS